MGEPRAPGPMATFGKSDFLTVARHQPAATIPPRARDRTRASRPPMPDFLGTQFPEDAFPPPTELAAAYQQACRRGYAAMAGMRVAITGLARNIGDMLPLTIARIERLASRFANYRVVIYENDSTDATKPLLLRWANANPRVMVTMENCADPANPATRCLARAERMARYRERCQSLVLEHCGDFDATIVLDLDVAGGWSEDGVAHSFGQRGWDFIGTNGLIYRRDKLRINALRQYDMWALRMDADLTPIPTAHAARHIYHRGESLIPVTSCFGGMGIYRMEAFRQGRYGATDCEHAVFHRHLIEAGFSRLFLNPSQIVVYGRRHRFGDKAAASLLRSWNAFAGRAGQPWIFDKRERAIFAPAEPAAQIRARSA
jgi:glycosyltransferase involved in cell wall biosynthesis